MAPFAAESKEGPVGRETVSSHAKAGLHVGSEGASAPSSLQYQSPIVVGLVLLFAGISVAMIQYKVPTIMTDLMGLFSMDAGTASWLMSIFTLVSIFLAIPAGSLAQRLGAKRTLVFASVIAICGSIIGLLSNTSPMLLASRGVEGAALTILTTCGPIIVRQNVDPDKVGTAMGIWGIWGCLGSTAAAIVTPTIFSQLGFDGLWAIFACIAAVAAIIVLVVIRKPATPVICADGMGEPERIPRYRDIFSKNTALFFGSFIVYNICMLAILAFVPTILQMQGFDPTLSGIISTAPMLLSMISSPLFGVISDKTGRNKPLLILAMAVMGPCTFLLYTQTGALLWIGVLVMGLVGMGGIGQYLSGFMKLLPSPDLTAMGMGVLVTFQGVGQFLGTFLVQILLGAQLSEWFLAGAVLMAMGFVGTGLMAICKLP